MRRRYFIGFFVATQVSASLDNSAWGKRDFGTGGKTATSSPVYEQQRDWDGDVSGMDFSVKSLVVAAYLPLLGKALLEKVLEVLIHTCIRNFQQMSSTKTRCSPAS